MSIPMKGNWNYPTRSNVAPTLTISGESITD